MSPNIRLLPSSSSRLLSSSPGMEVELVDGFLGHSLDNAGSWYVGNQYLESSGCPWVLAARRPLGNGSVHLPTAKR